MPVKWVDFKALKAQVGIRQVLERYGFLGKLRDKGQGKLVGPCPIHGGKNPNSFHANTEKNVFNCFTGCGGGNVLDLVAKIEKCDVRAAGEKLASWFGLEFSRSEGADNRATMRQDARSGTSATSPASKEKRAQESPPEVVNPPLESPLKTLNHDHAYLRERGLTAPTVKTFGVGFCVRGLMKGRIAIPIHNERGELVAYAGRAINDELAKEEGKYKLPGGFLKGHVVFNLNRAKEQAGKGVIVVEGFFDAMKVHQAGFPNVVALMGSTITEEQEELLVKLSDRLVLMLDGDEAGVAGVRRMYGRLRRKLYLKEVHLEDGQQPDGLSDEELVELLG